MEAINGINLQNADHSMAVQAVKESKGLLEMVSHMQMVNVWSCINVYMYRSYKEERRLKLYKLELLVPY